MFRPKVILMAMLLCLLAGVQADCFDDDGDDCCGSDANDVTNATENWCCSESENKKKTEESDSGEGCECSNPCCLGLGAILCSPFWAAACLIKSASSGFWCLGFCSEPCRRECYPCECCDNQGTFCHWLAFPTCRSLTDLTKAAFCCCSKKNGELCNQFFCDGKTALWAEPEKKETEVQTVDNIHRCPVVNGWHKHPDKYYKRKNDKESYVLTYDEVNNAGGDPERAWAKKQSGLVGTDALFSDMRKMPYNFDVGKTIEHNDKTYTIKMKGKKKNLYLKKCCRDERVSRRRLTETSKKTDPTFVNAASCMLLAIGVLVWHFSMKTYKTSGAADTTEAMEV